MSRRNDTGFVVDMRDHAREAVGMFGAASADDIESDRMLPLALERLSRTVARPPVDFRLSFWRRIRRFPGGVSLECVTDWHMAIATFCGSEFTTQWPWTCRNSLIS